MLMAVDVCLRPPLVDEKRKPVIVLHCSMELKYESNATLILMIRSLRGDFMI